MPLNAHATALLRSGHRTAVEARSTRPVRRGSVPSDDGVDPPAPRPRPLARRGGTSFAAMLRGQGAASNVVSPRRAIRHRLNSATGPPVVGRGGRDPPARADPVAAKAAIAQRAADAALAHVEHDGHIGDGRQAIVCTRHWHRRPEQRSDVTAQRRIRLQRCDELREECTSHRTSQRPAVLASARRHIA